MVEAVEVLEVAVVPTVATAPALPIKRVPSETCSAIRTIFSPLMLVIVLTLLLVCMPHREHVKGRCSHVYMHIDTHTRMHTDTHTHRYTHT